MPTGTESSQSRSPSPMITILYVDDEQALLQVGKVFLERNKDYSVDIVTSATRALGMMDTRHYDAVIADYQMPGMDGIAFLHEVRGRGNTVPFILFTGKGREEVVIQALNEGADFYLQKGGDPRSQFAELSHKIQLAVEKRRAEASIRDHERRETDIINFLPDATFAIDAAGTVIAWNRAMEEMTGIPAAEMLGKGNYEYALPLYHERRPILIDIVLKPNPDAEKRYPAIQRQGDRLTAELHLPHMNGGRGMLIWFVASPLYDTEGRVVGAIESIRDVTARKRSEEVLRDAETKFASVFESNPIPLTLVTADDGLFANVNAAFLKNTGYDRAEVIGRTPWDLGLFIIQEEYERLAAEIRLKGFVNGMEVRCRPKAGGIQYCSFSSCIVIIAGRPHILSTIENITARRLAEDALRESEEKYRVLFSSITDAVFVHQLNGEKTHAGPFVEVNDQACRMLGFTRGELLGLRPQDVTAPDSVDILPGILKRHLNGEDVTFSAILVRKDGTTFAAEIHSHTFMLGKALSVISIVRDITVRKQVEEELIMSQIRLSQAMDLAHLVSWEFDVPTEMFTFNDRFYAMYGTTAEREGGYRMTALEYAKRFLPVEEQVLVANEVQKAMGAADPQFISRLEHRIIRRDGEIRNIVVQFGIVKDAAGKTVRTYGANQDITERKRAEEALRESERKYRTLVDTATESILIAQEGRVVFANPRLCQLLGVPEAALVGQPIADFIWPEDREVVVRRHWDRMAGEDVPATYDLRVIGAGGEMRWVAISVALLTWQGRPASLNMLTDITGRRKAEEALRQANRQLLTMTQITRHDISNQALASLAFLELAKTEPLSLQGADYLEKVGTAIRTIQSQITFTKVYQDLGSHAPQWISLASIADGLAVPEPISLKADPGTFEVYADAMFEKVFFNLLDNSVRHGGHVTEVRLCAREADGALSVVWEDNGTGIPPGEKEAVFERGYGRNTGLGLFLAREILGMTGISIREVGIPGKGARFEITVPAGAWRQG